MPVPAYCYIVATNTIHASDDNLARIRYSSQFSQSQLTVFSWFKYRGSL